MKRKIALILAGCLAISPVSAGLYPSQARAAETDTISEVPEQTPIVILVKDENDVSLQESGEESEAEKYTVKVGESHKLTALVEQGPDSPVLSEWSSDKPEIIAIDDEGVITVQSVGVCKIFLSVSIDAAQEPFLFEYEIVSSEEAKEASDEDNTAESANPADSAETDVNKEEAASEVIAEAATETTTSPDAASETAQIIDNTKKNFRKMNKGLPDLAVPC